MEEERKKLSAAVTLGRRGGRVKSEAKAAAVRLNGLLGGAASWKKPRDQWKPRKKKKMVVIKTPKPKVKKITPAPPPMVEHAHVILKPRTIQKPLLERLPR